MGLLRNVIRSLRRSPGFAVTVVLTLAVGIGLNDAIFTVVDCVLLRPLDYHNTDRLLAIETLHYPNTRPSNAVAGDDFTDLARDVHGLESAAFYSNDEMSVRVGQDATYLHVAMVSPGFTETVGVMPMAGRSFTAVRTLTAQYASEALVSASFARAQFGSPVAAVGQVIHAGPLTREIVGVLPEGFHFPQHTDLWIEAGTAPDTTNRTAYNQAMVARRRGGTTPQTLAAELQTEASRLAASYPEDRNKQFVAVPLLEEITGRLRPTLHLLMGAVAVLLLIACTNIAHLQIVRGARRLHAVAVRKALGASRAVLLREALLEATLLAAAGAAGAACIALPALRLLLRFAPAGMPRLQEIHLNTEVFLVSVAVSIVLMAVTAVLPIVQMWAAAPAGALRGQPTRGMESRGLGRLRRVLMGAEVALTMVLSVAALLLARQLIAEGHVDLGFDAAHLLTLDTDMTAAEPLPPLPEHSSPQAKAAAVLAAAEVAQGWANRLDAIVATVQATPGVRSAAAIEGAPMGFGAVDVLYAIRGRHTMDSNRTSLPDADVHAVTPNFFAVMGAPLLRGRLPSGTDRLFAPSVVLINETLARQQFPGQDPVGHQIQCGYDFDSSWWTIVGVVGDLRAEAPGKAVAPTFYVPLAQHPQKANGLQVIVRTRAGAGETLQPLQSVLKQRYPDLAVKATTMTENIAEVERLDHLRSLLFDGFAAVSLFLAALGMYGVTAYSAAQRRFEFGLRAAVGARRGQLLAMVLREALEVALGGVVLGGVVSLLLNRALRSVVGQVPAFDAGTYALAVLMLLALALLAAGMPARRAAAAQPMEVLRYE